MRETSIFDRRRCPPAAGLIGSRMLAGLVAAALASPAQAQPYPSRPKQLAAEARPGTPEELAAFVAAEIPKWQAMAKLAGVTGE